MRGAWLTAAVLALVPISALAQTPTGTPVTIQSLANRVASQIQANSFAGVNVGAGSVSPSDTGTQDTIANSIAGRLLKSANLSDLTNPATARVNLGLGALAQLGVGSGLTSAGGNLSANVTTVAGRTGAVTLGTGDVSGLGALATLGAGSGLTSSGGALSVTYGTASGTSAQGNDSRITGALQAASVPLSALLGGTGGGVTGVTVGSGLSIAAGSLSANVTTVAGRSGAVTLGSGDVSGLAPSATTDTTNAANVTSGTLDAARLPAPTATALGGVQSIAGVSHQWVNSISTSGAPSLSQPSVADVSGAAPLASPTFTGAVTLPSWTTAPSNAAGVVGFNSATGRYEFGVGGSTVNHVRLSGDTMTGALTVPGVTNTGSQTVAGTLGVTGAVTGNAGLTSAGTSTIIAGSGSSDHIVLTPTAAGAVPSITATGSDGLKLTAQNGGSVFVSGGSPLNVGNGFTYTVGSTAVAPQFQHNFNIAGVATGDPQSVYSGGSFIINSDTLQLPDVNQAFNGWQFTHGLAAGFTGNRHATQFNISLNGASGNTIASGTLGYYTTILGYAIASVNDNGTGLTSTTSHGRMTAGNLNVELRSGATNFFGATALEINSEIDTGASSLVRTFLNVAAVAGAVQGTQVDAGIWMYSAGGALIKTGILFGSGGLNQWPVDPAGTLIGTDTGGGVTVQAAHGVYLAGVTFTADSWNDGHFRLTGAGELIQSKITDPSTAPGAGQVKITAESGTTAGTCKLVARAGTSATPVTIIDNIGGGC